MVGNKSSVTADRIKQKKLKGHPALNGVADTITQARRIYNKSMTGNNDTMKLAAQNRLLHANNLKLTISKPDPPTGSGAS